jgi:hypothetical protein
MEANLIPELLSEEEFNLVQKFRDGYRGVYWSINDFEVEAYKIEKYEDTGLIYDRSKFKHALDEMTRRHDCNNGVTWDTIRFYLEEYCLFSNID